jgi:putative salt-induced outer membrane protein
MFLRWSISKNAQFRQSITIESGKSNTLTESITSVTSTLVGNLGMSLRLDITRNSDVPVGTKNTDTVTSVNLVYNF